MDSELKKEIIDLIKETSRQDYIEIGNAKTGTVKVAVDFEKPSEAEGKLSNATRILKANRDEVLG